MKIKTLMTSLVLAALPLSGALGKDEVRAPQIAEAIPSFKIERAYFGPQGEAVSADLAGLIRSLDRARQNGLTRRVAHVDRRRVFHGNSMDLLVREQDWRTRVSQELKALLH